MASKIKAGLIVAGLLVIFFGFVIGFDLVVSSEEDSRETCEAANLGDTPENETCDSTDRKFIGFQTLFFILAIFAVGAGLIWAGFSRN